MSIRIYIFWSYWGQRKPHREGPYSTRGRLWLRRSLGFRHSPGIGTSPMAMRTARTTRRGSGQGKESPRGPSPMLEEALMVSIAELLLVGPDQPRIASLQSLSRRCCLHS